MRSVLREFLLYKSGMDCYQHDLKCSHLESSAAVSVSLSLFVMLQSMTRSAGCLSSRAILQGSLRDKHPAGS